MLNLAKNNCMGAFVYNDSLFDYIVKNGKPITEIPTERDENEPNVSPLIALCHVPSRKVNAYKSWFFFKKDYNLIHTESGALKTNNDDFMYILYADDYRISKGKPVKVYNKIIHEGLGTYKNFIDEETKLLFLSDKDKFDFSYTPEELYSDWYEKFIRLNS